jgi:hypothetical protein
MAAVQPVARTTQHGSAKHMRQGREALPCTRQRFCAPPWQASGEEFTMLDSDPGLRAGRGVGAGGAQAGAVWAPVHRRWARLD